MRDFIAELKKKKRDLTIGGIATLIAMFLCTKTPYNLLIFVPIIGYIIFSVKIWRCPNCNLYLGKARNLKNCKGCGERLV